MNSWSLTYFEQYIKEFGLPPSASCSVDRNFNDEVCRPLVSVLKGYTSIFVLFKIKLDVPINTFLTK